LPALNYPLVSAEGGWVNQNLGPENRLRLIDSKIPEILKALTARCSALELVSKRAGVWSEIKELRKSALTPSRVVVDDFSVVNFKRSKYFEDAIEAKQNAEQLTLKAQKDPERIKFEADKKIVSAKAKAESLRLQKENGTPQLSSCARSMPKKKPSRNGTGPCHPFAGGNDFSVIDLKNFDEK
jgi:regulator of protease activity HflC (stomatin/prohibitin superfamily)